jgi:uncharacterized surface protein with fasciclin (FAS1) repeats
MFKTFAIGTLAALALALAAPRASTVHAETGNIVETAVAAGSFETLARALEAADLVDTLTGPGPFTVFAPTDDAFARLPAGTLEGLLEPAHKSALRRVLTYHVVPGRLMASDVMTLQSAKAVSGDSIAVKVENGVVRVGGARVTKPDIAASNGVIHVVDAVMLPEGL